MLNKVSHCGAGCGEREVLREETETLSPRPSSAEPGRIKSQRLSKPRQSSLDPVAQSWAGQQQPELVGSGTMTGDHCPGTVGCSENSPPEPSEPRALGGPCHSHQDGAEGSAPGTQQLGSPEVPPPASCNPDPSWPRAKGLSSTRGRPRMGGTGRPWRPPGVVVTDADSEHSAAGRGPLLLPSLSTAPLLSPLPASAQGPAWPGTRNWSREAAAGAGNQS